MSRPKGAKTWIEVSRAALRANAAALKSAARGSALIAVIKSNAYGHGTAEVVRALGDIADWFAVDSFAEAQAARRAGAKQHILILGYTLQENLAAAVKAGFRLTVYNRETANALCRLATRRRPAYVHLKIETGTSRQGVLSSDLLPLVKRLRRNLHVVIEGASTHFANIEDTTDSTFAERQLERYRRAVAVIEGAIGGSLRMRHTACSAAAILFPQTHFDAVRTGIALYGLWPSGETRVSARSLGRDLELRPALTWKTVVAQVKRLPAGTPIGYGLTEKLERNSRIAVLPVGYWDGLDRKLSSMGHVLIHGRRAKILGRVCMNICVVDVTDIRGVKSEDEVVLLGRQGKETIAAEEVAGQVGTINYEIVTRINPMASRTLVP